MVDINKNTRCLTINVSSGSNKQNSTQADCEQFHTIVNFQDSGQ